MIVWCVVAGVGASVVVALLAVVLGGLRLGENREKWHDQTTGPAGAMFNALFLASLALSVVLGWQAYDHAKGDVANEASAVASLYDDLGALPAPEQSRLRTEVADYAESVVHEEWGSASSAVDRRLGRLSDQVMALADDDQVSVVRSDVAVVRADRDLRLRDMGTRLPAGLLICLAVAAVVVLGHGLLVGSPHALASLVPLVVEAGLIGGAVCLVFAIRQPFHGALVIGPDDLRAVIAGFSAGAG